MKFSHILNLIFVILISIPLVAMNIGGEKKSEENIENRKSAQFPKVKWGNEASLDFPQEAGEYFSDNFGLRIPLTRLLYLWKLDVLQKELPNPQLIQGKEGWLYFHHSCKYLKQKPLSEEEITQWVKTTQARADWIRSRGGYYVIAIAPNKATLYPEFLPDEYAETDASKTIAGQIVNAIRDRTDVEVIDLIEFLKEKKTTGKLYDKTDTHWNDKGAFFATNKILEHLHKKFPEIASNSIEDYETYHEENFSGDMGQMTLLTDRFQERAIRLRSTQPVEWSIRETDEITEARIGSNPVFISTSNNPDLPKAVIFRDSFATKLTPYLAPHFSEATYVWDNDDIDTAKIESIRPQIVIHEVVDRFLLRAPTFKPKQQISK